MERKLASVQKIISINPIEGADKIEVCEVLGWQVVVKKGEHQVGEKIVYIETDAIVPSMNPYFDFMQERRYRVRVIRLRKQISQGLVVPLALLPPGNYNEGDDVTELLGVTKYLSPTEQREINLELSKKSNTKKKLDKYLGRFYIYSKFFMKKKNKWPEFVKKTDEDRIQLFPRICEVEKDTIWSVSEKLDGTSSTYFLTNNHKRWYQWWVKPYTFGVCSRNVYLRVPNSSINFPFGGVYWKIAKQLHIEKVLHSIIGKEDFVILQGEIIGEGIQKNKYNIKGHDFRAFNLIYPPYDYVPSDQAEGILSLYGIKFVPILSTNYTLKPTINECVQTAIAKSVVNPKIQREGIVIRNYKNRQGLKSLKIINPEFLLAYQDEDEENQLELKQGIK